MRMVRSPVASAPGRDSVKSLATPPPANPAPIAIAEKIQRSIASAPTADCR